MGKIDSMRFQLESDYMRGWGQAVLGIRVELAPSLAEGFVVGYRDGMRAKVQAEASALIYAQKKIEAESIHDRPTIVPEGT